MNLLDILFPKYCVNCKKLGSYLCANCFSYISFNQNYLCLICGNPCFDGKTHPRCKTKYSIDGAFSALEYKGIVKKILYQFKYKPYLSDLKSVLSDFLYESLIQDENFMSTMQQYNNLTIFFVPIPLHPSRLKTRGYNHAEILAKELEKKFGIPVSNLLERTKNTVSQFGLNKKERKENIRGAFSLSRHPELVSGSTAQGIPKQVRNDMEVIILVDDILTTGSTLKEAAYTLKKSGAKQVFAITLAKD